MRSLEIHADVRQYYHVNGRTPFFQNLELTVAAGRITSLLGPSGAGKTTLIRILMSASPGTMDGRIEYRFPERQLSSAEARREGLVGYLFQGQSLLPWSTVRDNLLLPARLNPRVQGPTEDQIRESVQRLNLTIECLELKPHQLSFGMKQRVAFARILLYRPHFLFLDEMFAGLDSANAEDLGCSLKTYVQDELACCLLVSHDVHLSMRLSNAFLYLSADRRLTDLGTQVRPEEVLIKMRADVRQTREVTQ